MPATPYHPARRIMEFLGDGYEEKRCATDPHSSAGEISPVGGRTITTLSHSHEDRDNLESEGCGPAATAPELWGQRLAPQMCSRSLALILSAGYLKSMLRYPLHLTPLTPHTCCRMPLVNMGLIAAAVLARDSAVVCPDRRINVSGHRLLV